MSVFLPNLLSLSFCHFAYLFCLFACPSRLLICPHMLWCIFLLFFYVPVFFSCLSAFASLCLPAFVPFSVCLLLSIYLCPGIDIRSWRVNWSGISIKEVMLEMIRENVKIKVPEYSCDWRLWREIESTYCIRRLIEYYWIKKRILVCSEVKLILCLYFVLKLFFLVDVHVWIGSVKKCYLLFNDYGVGERCLYVFFFSFVCVLMKEMDN